MSEISLDVLLLSGGCLSNLYISVSFNLKGTQLFEWMNNDF